MPDPRWSQAVPSGPVSRETDEMMGSIWSVGTIFADPACFKQICHSLPIDMDSKTELRLELSPKKTTTLARRSWIKAIAQAPAKRRRLESVYFDTDKLDLRKHGIGLRIGRDEQRTIQTINKDCTGSCGVFETHEWKTEIRGSRPDLRAAKNTALGDIDSTRLRQKLRPFFETSVERTTIPLRLSNAEISLAIDRGTIRAGRKREAVNEIEFELKNGQLAGLAGLARKIADDFSATYVPMSKGERGFTLSCGRKGEPVRASGLTLSRDLCVSDAFKAITQSCLHHFAANAGAVEAGKPEGVHQMRVGLRRLRAAISLFKDLINGPETERMKHDLKWLTTQLSPARDLDVFISEAVEPLEKSHAVRSVSILRKDAVNRREEGFRKARLTVKSAKYAKLTLDLALWLADGEWLTTRNALAEALRSQPLKQFAARDLSRRSKTITRKILSLRDLDDRRRHKLRIAVKKLRYATEFFSALYDSKREKKKRRHFQKILKEIRSKLGKLNDFRVHKELANDYSHPRRHTPRKPEKAYVLGMIMGGENVQAQKLLSGAIKSGMKLKRTPNYWK